MRARLIISLLSLTALVLGCPESAPVRSSLEQDVAPAGSALVAVMPFVHVSTEEAFIRCPVSGDLVKACHVADNAESALGRLLSAALSQRPDIHQAPWDRIREEMDALSMEESLNLDRYSRLQLEIARRVQADLVLFGVVYCFKERSGNAYASATPASVGFSLFLLDAATEKLVWKSSFSEEQQALSEDLFKAEQFIKRGGKWVTAAELAEEGISEMVRQIPVGGREG